MPTSESRVSVEAFLGRPSPSASLSATAGPFHGQRTPGFVVSRSICWQQIQTGQRRLVLDISDTRSVRKNDHPCSPPLRITIHQSWAQLACAPERYMLWPGGWIEPTRVSRRSAHSRDLLVLRCYEN